MFSIFKDNQVVTETLHHYVSRKLEPYGSPKYAYTVLSKKNPLQVFIVSDYPEEWVNLYYSNNFQLIDPVILTALTRLSPFAWDDNITLLSDLKFKKIFSASRKYNIINGFTFVLHDYLNNLAILSLIIDQKLDIEERITNGLGDLQVLLIDIHQQMYKLSQTKKSGTVFSGKQGEKSIFTARENEVLYWASMGKTYADIANITGISVRTVKFHMGNVVRKPGVNNARQAIRLGIELLIIKPVR